jgi:hypothetical protein
VFADTHHGVGRNHTHIREVAIRAQLGGQSRTSEGNPLSYSGAECEGPVRVLMMVSMMIIMGLLYDATLSRTILALN